MRMDAYGALWSEALSDASAAVCNDDVVVFLSQPADSCGHRSLLLSSPQGYHLPPMASIKLERIEDVRSPSTPTPAPTPTPTHNPNPHPPQTQARTKALEC